MSKSSTKRFNARRAEERRLAREAREMSVNLDVPADLQELASLTRSPIDFEGLCDKLNMSPRTVRVLLEKAKAFGIQLQMGNNHVQLSPEEQVRTVQQTRIQPTTGPRQKIGVISDTHFGSKYCLRDQIVDCVNDMYSRGVRHILHCGDFLDGCYRHGVFELSHSGLEDQTRDAFEVLPKAPGLRYHCITGNHDYTFTSLTGVNVGRYITGYFASEGRNDITFYGDRGAFIDIMGAVIHMWHPLKGMSYALSYALQKQIEKYGPAQKPHILLAGHWHQFCEIEQRGVYGLALPTFQGHGSAFSRALGGDCALGGVILEYEVAGEDLIRNFSVERRRYFEVEKPTRV